MDYDAKADGLGSYELAYRVKLARVTAALVALAEFGIEPDTQELLVSGNPMRGIAPGALDAAISAAIRSTKQEALI